MITLENSRLKMNGMFSMGSPKIDHLSILKNWIPLSLVDFTSEISKYFKINFMRDFIRQRDQELYEEWKGSEIVDRWCILENRISIGITSDNQIIQRRENARN